jgi:biotin synthase
MNPKTLRAIHAAADEGQAVSPEMALAILRSGVDDLTEIFCATDRMKRRFFGNAVHLCSIVNARSGACTEDCAFCAQSVHHRTKAEVFGLIAADEIARAYEKACGRRIQHFGVVTSGEALDPAGVELVCRAVRDRKIEGVAWCASLGALDAVGLARLKEAGVRRFHHNLETAESFFPSVCSTHTYVERRATIRAARAAGLEICSGGILGMGESPEQRVELAAALAAERVNSIPLNFLIPIAGTRLERQSPMSPLEILRTVAMFRMVNPDAEIKVCAGRVHLRDLQAMIFQAGASGMMIGPLLTVAGRDVAQDLQMLKDLEVDHAS